MHTRTLYFVFPRSPRQCRQRCPIRGPRYNAPPASGSECRSTYACAPRKQRALLSRLAIPDQVMPRQPQFISTSRGPQSYYAAQRQRSNPAHRGASPSMGPFTGGPTSRGRQRRFKTPPVRRRDDRRSPAGLPRIKGRRWRLWLLSPSRRRRRWNRHSCRPVVIATVH